ncbi:MAG: hypothetical protein AMS17_07295 [Spirochaetes bacterium DG_61]|nr:MAG: hypothetical protein AMS17_07295 [Spirochaetes bacterium DG_61]
MESSITYFEESGQKNTTRTLEIAKRRASELGIRTVLVASTHGHTALEASKIFKGSGVNVISVSISAAFDDEGWTMTARERERIEKAEVKVLTSLHALADGVVEGHYGESTPGSIIADTLRCFSQGTKVAFEIAIMALEAGMVQQGEEMISIGGTNEGADTAIVVKPSFARKVKSFRILEILCKPRLA